MRVTFFSNLLHHHQIPFCNEMYKILGNDFTFVSTIEFPENMLKIGYSDPADQYPYNLSSFKNNDNYIKALELGATSDIVIMGAAPEIFIKQRLLKNKHTFRYSERFFKKINYKLLHPYVWMNFYSNHYSLRNKNVYMLCASAYQANDCNSILSYKNKKYKWGYFTKIEDLDIEKNLMEKRNKQISILWIARFLDWKHPELIVRAAKILKDKGYEFLLNMIGTGERFNKTVNLISNLKLESYISLLGSMPNEQVLLKMKKSHLFVFTSDRNEGWGAVLNEAMASGCAVVASHKIGAVPYLINNNQNGLIFKSLNLDDLVNKIEMLLQNEILRETISREAYRTMQTTWSPKVAASSFIQLAESKLNNTICEIEYGPCSIATPIKHLI